MCESSEPVLFAGNSNLFSSGSDATTLQGGINNDMATIADWPEVNKLSFFI